MNTGTALWLTFTVKAGTDHLALIASAKPVAALSEIIWNGFDAKSTAINVVIEKNEAFDSIDSIKIIDKGCGIPHSKVVDLFGKLGESWKKDAKAGGDRSLHGQYGRGRFKALSLGASVKWLTIYEEHGEFYEYSISADANKINDFSVSETKLTHCKESGTIVEISNLSNDKGELLSENSIIDLTKEFALFLTEYPSKKLIFNTISISPKDAWEDKNDYDLGEVELLNGQKTNLSISVIEWKRKVQREMHFCDNYGFSLFKEKLGPVIRAPGYDFTIYAKSQYFKDVNDKNTLGLSDLIPEIKQLKDLAIQRTRTHFLDKAFLERVKIVDDWKKQDIYPYTNESTQNPTDIIERKVFDILAVNVQSYLKSSDSPDKKTKNSHSDYYPKR